MLLIGRLGRVVREGCLPDEEILLAWHEMETLGESLMGKVGTRHDGCHQVICFILFVHRYPYAEGDKVLCVRACNCSVAVHGFSRSNLWLIIFRVVGR